jgi:hypothetical protein
MGECTDVQEISEMRVSQDFNKKASLSFDKDAFSEFSIGIEGEKRNHLRMDDE